MRLNKETVAQKVRERLEGIHPCGVALEVVTAEIYRVHNKWWRVPVHPSRWPADKDRRELYDVMVDVEGALQDEEGLPILLESGDALVIEEFEALAA